MLVDVYYANWHRPKSTELSEKLITLMFTGYQEGQEVELSEDSYTEDNFILPDDFNLEKIFAYLNSDDRPNGDYERSMCVGDVVKINDKYYGCCILGFVEVNRVK